MNMKNDPCISPDGRFEVVTEPWEARASQWVESPRIRDARTGVLVFEFVDCNWLLDAAAWESATRVRMTLRKFPGNHSPCDLDATVDCEHCTAALEGLEPLALNAFEALPDRQLTWT